MSWRARAIPAPTMADVAKAAGLSSGIVNFHFETKEKLLVETLKYLADEYRANWQKALKARRRRRRRSSSKRCCSPISATRISARRASSRPGAPSGREAQSRPTYLEHCGVQ